MRVNELRIGNLVDTKEHKSVVISSINSINDGLGYIWHNHNFGYYQLKTFEPIPLTEEWLLKFGFTLTSIGGYFNIENKDELLYIFINKDSCGIAIENKYADADESEELSFNIKIQHVHQLQNLYFALTGEELTLQS